MEEEIEKKFQEFEDRIKALEEAKPEGESKE